jgi:hypothetical protein
MATDLTPPEREVLDELVRQGIPRDDALAIVRNLLAIDWGRIFWDREELAVKAGVALATISYQATRIDSDPLVRPSIRKGGDGVRAHATLWLGSHALWAMNKRRSG